MTPPDAKERWARRILGGVGARPLGHTDPDDGPQVPVQPPQPPAPSSSPRLPDWWRTGRPDIGAPPAAPEPVVDELDEDEDGHEDDDEYEEQQPVKTAPIGGGPVEKVPDGPKRTTVRKTVESAAEDQRLRLVAFNLTAAGVGYSFGLVQMIRAYMPVAEQAAVGIFGLVLAAAGAWFAWRASGVGAVRAVFQEKTPLLRIVVSAGAAGIGHELGPVPVAYLNEYGQKWGLGPSAISLLITTVGICGLLWWFIDRRLRPAHWLIRWMFRIPLASALIACIPYGSTPVV